MGIYKCFKSDFEDLKKQVDRITRKLDKYGCKWNFAVIGESVEEVSVIDATNYDDVPAWQFKPVNKGKIAVEVVSYNFEMDFLKLGDYEVIAVLDHNAGNENMVHVIREGTIIPAKYRTVKSVCEHCNSDRIRNKTVLLQDKEGNIKQVGTTCIKEYTGVDGLDIIKGYQDIHDIIIYNNNLYMDDLKIGRYPKYDTTVDYLAACIQLVKTKGYDKETTKYDAWEIAGTDKQDKKYIKVAKEVINYFTSRTFLEGQDFLNNIKIALSNEYSKVSGFVAYAYIAYEKQLDYEAKQDEQKKSDFVGNIGDKLEIELTLKKRIPYETHYSYRGETSYIYLFEDENGNQYKWNSAKYINLDENTNIKIKGSIKAHDVYKEVKQTVLTRCKVI